MKKIYIVVSILFAASIIIFLLSFVYLDRVKHKIYYYAINLDGHEIGTIKIDKFDTEDKLIYKSVSNMPLAQLFTEERSKIALDTKYNIESYGKDRTANNVVESSYLTRDNDTISFLNQFESRFSYLNNIPIKRETFIFDEESPATYLPIIENYDFKKGRTQGFNALTFFPDLSLPPMKRFVALTSIRDGYIDVGTRKIKAENLILKIRNYPQGSIWIAKYDKSLLRIEIPKRKLLITRIFSPKKIEVRHDTIGNDEYISKDLTFKNKNVELAGTMTVPKGEGRFPAVLLIWGRGPQDREYQGLFTSMADYLSKNGFCVLRFDKRGVGLSGGDASSYTHADELEDITAALDYLANQKEVDTGNMTVIAHSEGAAYALELASGKNNIRGIIFMSPVVYLGYKDEKKINALKNTSSRGNWTEDYLRLAALSMKTSEERASALDRNWTSILGKRVFLKNMREEASDNQSELVKNLKVPILVLQGKEDEVLPPESVTGLDKALTDSGNSSHIFTYYGYLGHFFGKAVNDGIHKIHYEADGEVLDNIKNWINSNIPAPAPTESI